MPGSLSFLLYLYILPVELEVTCLLPIALVLEIPPSQETF